MAKDSDNWFVGIPVDDSALPASALRDLPARTRTIHPDDLHVTVAFLGAVGANRALAAWSHLAPPAAAPLIARVGPRAAFGPRRQPSAIGLDLEADRPDAPLARFVAARRDPLREAAGLAADTRAVRPHLTLGRPPRRAGPEWWRACDRWLAERDADTTLHLDRIALYTRAHDREDDRRYRRVRCTRWPRTDDDREDPR